MNTESPPQLTLPQQPRAVRASTVARTRGPLAAVAAVVALALVIPGITGAAWLGTLTTCAIFAIVASGVGLLYGWLGLTSLTQVALAGVGGWVTLRFGFGTGLPFLADVALGGIITGCIGVVLALPALRVRGLQLALVTLMIAGGFDVLFNGAGFPNGGGGFLGYQSTGELARLSRPAFATSDQSYFRFVLIVAALAFVVVQIHLKRGPGRQWALIAESEAAATGAGISLVRSQVWAFALAATLAGVAGGLLAGQVGQLAPSTFEVTQSMTIFALVAVAGGHHWIGWLFAAVLYKVLPFWFDQIGIDGHIATMIFGALLVLNMLGSPRGAVGQVEEIVAKVRDRRVQRA